MMKEEGQRICWTPPPRRCCETQPQPSNWLNQVALTGLARVTEALRYTPAGVPVLELTLEHGSRQSASGRFETRRALRGPAPAGGPQRQRAINRLDGQVITAHGFLAAAACTAQTGAAYPTLNLKR